MHPVLVMPSIRQDRVCAPLPLAGTVDPAAPALVWDRATMSHGELRERVDDLVGRLPDSRDGRLLVHLTPEPTAEAVIAYLAVLEAGHVALISGAGDPGRRLAQDWSPDLNLGAGEPVALGRALHTHRGGPGHLLHPELALLLSTSGSTGAPKLVRLAHANVAANARGIAAGLGLTARDRGITSLPLHYCYGLSVLHSHLSVGASVALTDSSVLDADFWAEVDRGVTTMAVVPHQVELMETTGILDRAHPTLRLITQAGGRMDPDRVRRTVELGRRRGWGLSVMYGQSENTARISIQEPDLTAEAPDAVGRPIRGTQILLDTSVPEASDGVGEIIVRGSSVMLGYAEHPHDLALGRMVADLRTGDLGRIDDGVLRIVGRRSGFIKVLGLRIDIGQVERSLEENGLVCAVSGDDDGLRVAVEPVNGEPEGRLRDRTRRAAAAACGLSPASVHVAVRLLARLANGKVDRVRCDALVLDADADRSTGECHPGETVEAQVAAELAGLLCRDIDLGRSFADQGGDSLSHVSASVRLSVILGPLPRDWHHRPLIDIIAARSERTSATPQEGPRRWVHLESSVLLRAVAVLIILGSHAGLFRILGGAHTLLVVAGFNAALFALSVQRTRERVTASLRLIVGVAIPTAAVAAVGLTYGRYGWDNVLLVNWLVGDIAYGKHNELWFIDALVACTLSAALVLAVPAIARRWRSDPWPVAMGLVVVMLVPRFVVLALFDGVLRGIMPTVMWLFAVGMALAVARHGWQRLVTLGAMAVGILDFFPGDPVRNLTVLGGTVMLALVPGVRVPAPMVPALGVLAAASLHIYLVQFQIIDAISHPAVATMVSLGVGVLLWRLTAGPVRFVQERMARAASSVPVPTQSPD